MLGKHEKVEVEHFGVVVCLPGAHRYLNTSPIRSWPLRLKKHATEIRSMMKDNKLLFRCGDRDLNNLTFEFQFKFTSFV